MASLMLASTDLLLSPRIPDKDLECIQAIIYSLVTKARSEDKDLQIVELICAKLTQQPEDKPALRLKVLFILYNLLASPYGKAFIYRKALKLATAGKATDCIIPTFKNIDSFVTDWGIENLEQRKLFLAIARILKDQKGMSKEYFNFLKKYLASFKGAGDDADAIGDTKEEAAAAILEFVKSSDLYQECITKMRLMSLLDLSSHYSGEIPYSAIIDALKINDDEVEFWIVKAISCKILDCKIDQLNQVVIVSRHTEGIFRMPQWQSLRAKLGVWRFFRMLYKDHDIRRFGGPVI